jgi:DDE superfamily endonuclease/Helix-turn-helix of DDE superfamily endonuclease
MMMEDPMTFMGVPASHIFLLQLLADKVKGQYAVENVMITLRKIRLNESFKVLGKFFCMGKSSISEIFRRTLPTVADCLEDFVYRVDPKVILSNLPSAFRFEYSSVTDILDCFEIQVQSPCNAEHRAILYSSYKGGTTLKFLICVTPDCFCTFLSRGYGGRIGDSTLTTDCGYMEGLTNKHQVMADRGFKGLEGVLDLQGVKLVRPPSISGGKPMSKDECSSGKKIAALRIHVERYIGKVRFLP